MAVKDKKGEGPVCNCGRADLYDEWLKQIEDKKNEMASTPLSQPITKKVLLTTPAQR